MTQKRGVYNMISLVIPVYNEEKIIKNTIKTIKEFMETHFNNNYQIIFVDDGSGDNTSKIISEVTEENIILISYEQNKGKGGAVRTGMLAADGDVIFYTDCDLAYGLEPVRAGYDIFEKNKEADIIIASRRKHKEGYASYTLLRKILSVGFFMVLKFYGGIKQSDSQSGLKGFRNEPAKKIFNLCETNGWAFDFEALLIADKLSYKVEEMPAKIINHNESKMSLGKDSIQMLKEIARIKKRVKNIK